MLGRWHQWRRHFSHERGYARQTVYCAPTVYDDDDFEQMMMEAVEREIADLPRDLQLAIQHVARAECLGVEVIKVAALAHRETRESLVSQALGILQRRLVAAGVL